VEVEERRAGPRRRWHGGVYSPPPFFTSLTPSCCFSARRPGLFERLGAATPLKPTLRRATTGVCLPIPLPSHPAAARNRTPKPHVWYLQFGSDHDFYLLISIFFFCNSHWTISYQYWVRPPAQKRLGYNDWWISCGGDG
jgi:hypothetical protein